MTEYELESFELVNYKSLKNPIEIQIPGTSIFLGANSSGKSNILESLLLLKQSFDEGLDLTLNGAHVKLGEYRDIVHNRELSNRIGYKFNFKRDDRTASEGKNHECPICNKTYVYEGFYTNHLEDKHTSFWDKYSEDIEKFEAHLHGKTSIEFSFKFDEDTKSNEIYKFEVNNPSPDEGLFLSSIKLLNRDRTYRVIAEDLDENTIFDVTAWDSDVREEYPNTLSNMNQLLVSTIYLQSGREIGSDLPFRFSYRIQKTGLDEVYPMIHNYRENISDIFDNLYKGGDENEVGTENEFLLAQGLLGRLISIGYRQTRLLNMIRSYLGNISHIGPLRRNPQRIYFGSGGSPGGPFLFGDNIEEIIFRSQQSGEESILQQTNEWLDKTGFEVQLGINEVGLGDLYQLVAEENGLSINLADSGFGLSQTLPIIVQSVETISTKEREERERKERRQRFRGLRGGPNDKHEYSILIEQPEIHLNPRIEAALGDLFIKVMESDINLMIETHSEHLLNRFQRRIADGTIKDQAKLSVYFLTKENNVSTVQEIEFSDKGIFENWPEGFFQEDFEEAIEILKQSLSEN